MQRLARATLSLLAGLLWVTGQACAAPALTSPAWAVIQAQVSSSYGKLPLSFEINRGQSDGQVKFLARGQGYGLFLTPREAVLSLRAAQPNSAQAKIRTAAPGKKVKAEEPARAAVVRMRLAHANSNLELSGLDPLPGTSNYFIGNDQSKWQREVTHYARVKYAGVYPGIDLIYYGNQRQLEYDFVIAPGADPKRIKLVFEGARGLSLDKQGTLIVATAGGDLVQHKPVMYQEADGKRTEVKGRYVLRGRNRAGFHVASYDTRRSLVIDPVLSYSTFLGGSGGDQGTGIAVDASGSAYVTGSAPPSNFPVTLGAYQSVHGGGSSDVFVTKLNATGTALVYSTFLGGSGTDQSTGIAVDANGNAYVTGSTTSSNFPTTSGTFQAVYGGGGTYDAFVTKLNAAGTALVYSTYLGGNGFDIGFGIAVDASGSAYVAGATFSGVFPTTVGAYQTVGSGSFDAFVTKLNMTGTALVYSTYLGVDGYDDARSIAVDASGNAYVTGLTDSGNFPTTSGAFQAVHGGGVHDAFVTKLNATGTALAYSTFLGGSGTDQSTGIAVDANGNAYVTGSTTSSNFPVTLGAYQTVHAGNSDWDAFVTKLNATGTALVYSTFLGGSGTDQSSGIAVDASGNAYVTGYTGSSNFPITPDAYQSVYSENGCNSCNSDAFVTKLNAAGATLIYSTYLGGNSFLDDGGSGIAVDAIGNVYVAGVTGTEGPRNFPTTPGAYQTILGGGFYDTFVARFSGFGPSVAAPLVFGEVRVGGSSDRVFTFSNSGAANLGGKLEASSPYSVVLGGSFYLAPGATHQAVVRFEPDAAGPVDAVLRTTTNTGVVETPLQGSGATDTTVPKLTASYVRGQLATMPVGSMGDTLIIVGRSFGRTPGTVSINGAPLTAQSWSDGRISVAVPRPQDERTIRLNFPIDGATHLSANMNSIFDHAMNVYYGVDGVTTAFSGETALRKYPRTDAKTYAMSPCPPFNAPRAICEKSLPHVTLGSYGVYLGSGCGQGFDCTKYLQYDGHTGIDYNFPRGTQILAALPGIVRIPSRDNVYVKNPPQTFKAVAVEHGGGFETWYLHPSRQLIADGTQVDGGTSIAEVGCTGLPKCSANSGPDHLHFEVRRTEVVEVVVTDAAGKSVRRALKFSTPIDPYGWRGPLGMPDPYVRATNSNLWE